MSKVLEKARSQSPPGWENHPPRGFITHREIASEWWWDTVVFCCVKCHEEITHAMYCKCDLDFIDEYRKKQIVFHREGEHHVYKYRGNETGLCTPWHSYMVCDCGLDYYNREGFWVPGQGMWLNKYKTYPMDDELDYTGHPLYS